MNDRLEDHSSPKVVAVIVTFNRRVLLERVLARIESQNRPVQEIIVVDNNSSDGTEEFMAKLTQSVPSLIYLRLNENLGGAGGFYLGAQAAISRDADFVWLMDDDGHPSETCLARILDQAHLNNTIFNPLVIRESEPTLLAFGLGEDILTVEAAEALAQDGLVKGIANPFNGTLISRQILEQLGLPKKEMFIWGDEAEYMLRARKNGIRVATVVDAFFYHPPSKSQYDLLFGRFSIELKPKNLVGNHYRNLAYIKARYYGFKSTITYLVIHIIYFVSRGNLLEAAIFLAYALDGLLGKFILPKIRRIER